MKGFVQDIESIAIKNTEFRQVLYSARHCQLVVMALKPKEDYARREEITPRFTSQAGLKIMEILKLLPLTNCKACGYATCMAFAAALREGEIRLEHCPPLWEKARQDRREKLQDYLASYGWRPLDED